MSSHPLTHARVLDFDGTTPIATSLAGVADRSARLATALDGLDVGRDDVVATVCWDHRAHLEVDRAAICYTSGSTGSPKGVVYGQHCVFVHLLPARARGTLASVRTIAS